MKKFEFTGKVINVMGRNVKQIRSLVDIPKYCVSKGDVGGYIEHEINLSHENSCWVCDNAVVFGVNRVSGTSVVGGSAIVDNSNIIDSKVSCNAVVVNSDISRSIIDTRATVTDSNVYDSKISGTSIIGKCEIIENCEIYGDVRITGCDLIERSVISGSSHITNAKIRFSSIFDKTRIFGHKDDGCNNSLCINGCTLKHSATIDHMSEELEDEELELTDLHIYGDAYIRKEADVISMVGLGSAHRVTSIYRTISEEVGVRCGCFEGTLEQFRDKVEEMYGETSEYKNELYYNQYMALVHLAEINFGVELEECDDSDDEEEQTEAKRIQEPQTLHDDEKVAGVAITLAGDGHEIRQVTVRELAEQLNEAANANPDSEEAARVHIIDSMALAEQAGLIPAPGCDEVRIAEPEQSATEENCTAE